MGNTPRACLHNLAPGFLSGRAPSKTQEMWKKSRLQKNRNNKTEKQKSELTSTGQS